MPEPMQPAQPEAFTVWLFTENVCPPPDLSFKLSRHGYLDVVLGKLKGLASSYSWRR